MALIEPPSSIEREAKGLHGASAETAAALADQASQWLSSGEIEKAVRAVERLAVSHVLDLSAIDLGIWVAATAGRLDVTGMLMARAVELAPYDAERRLALSHRLAGEGKLDAARIQAEMACRLSPGSGDCGLCLGVILNGLGRHLDAVGELLRVAKLTPSKAEAFHHLAYASQMLGEIEIAASLAAHAYNLDRTNPSRALYVAHLLGQLDRPVDAIAILRNALTEGHGDASLHWMLCALLAQIGDFAAALVEIKAAIRVSPDNSEYHMLHSSILFNLRAFGEAAKAAARSASLDPGNLPALRHTVTLFIEGGDIQSALAAVSRLLAQAPDNEEYVGCMRHVLHLRGYTEGQVAFDILEAKRNAPPRPPARARGVGDAFETQARVVAALILREIRTRFGDSRLGYLWALIEPAIHIGVLALVFPFTMHGRPPLGDNFFFFYFTGIVPYLLFSHTVAHLSHSLVQNRPLLELPQVTNVDVLLARGILEFATIFVVALIFIGGFLVVGVSALPAAPGIAFSALLTMWLLGMGVGMISAVIGVFTKVWDHMFQAVIRVLYFTSGIFYVPAMMPEWVRHLLAWNPLMQVIDWFRTAFFTNYEPEWLNRRYPLVVGAMLVLAALALESAFRRKIQQSP